MIAKELLARIDIHFGEAHAGRRQLDVAFGEFGKAQKLQGFADGKEIVDRHLEAVGKRRQVGVGR